MNYENVCIFSSLSTVNDGDLVRLDQFIRVVTLALSDAVLLHYKNLRSLMLTIDTCLLRSEILFIKGLGFAQFSNSS